MLIDTHAHINDDKLRPYIEDIVSDIEKDNLAAIINVGCDYKSSIECVELADKYDKIYAVIGIHPHDAKSARKDMYDYFSKISENKKVVAIGEIGLDYYYDLSPREIQKKVFVEQLELAHYLKMPIVIHLRDAYLDMYNLLIENQNKLSNGFVLHCYSGSAEMAERFNKLDAYYSFGGAITFVKGKDKVIKAIPKDRLLLETDCPYMTPKPFRGKLNFPKYINLIGDKMSEFINIDRQEIDIITNKNAKTLFRRLTING